MSRSPNDLINTFCKTDLGEDFSDTSPITFSNASPSIHVNYSALAAYFAKYYIHMHGDL